MREQNSVLFGCKTFTAVLVCCISVIGVMSGCSKKQPAQEMPPRPVEMAKVIQKDINIVVDSFGTLAAINDVDVKCQVTGQLQDVCFKEGQEVSKGDILFTIDPREYKAQLDKAEAGVDEDLVDLKIKKDTLQRNKILFKKKLISQQDFEEYQTAVAAAQAKLALDKAGLELAEINLGYCRIQSPIAGITGKRQTDPGNIVTANSGPVLVNITTIDPLYVDFTLPERDLAKVRKAMSEGTLAVHITVPGESNTYSGELKFINNAVDDLTGRIALRAVVPNKDRTLWVGQFVRVCLILGVLKNALLVPAEAVQFGQQGPFLFAVMPDNTADLRDVTIAQEADNNLVIGKGVKSGETVVTVGQMGLSPGCGVADVSKQEAKPDTKAQQPGGKKPEKTQDAGK